MKLIVNGDDFGLSSGVNSGIIKAHRKGIVSSTTVMVNVANSQEVVDMVKQNPDLGVGIHLNITYGRPLLEGREVVTIIDSEGNFLRPEGMQQASLTEVEKEWRAQIQRFLSWGVQPSHLDSHHHIHTLPQFWPIIVQIARELAVPVRQRNHQMKRDLQEAGLPAPDHFIESFYGPTATIENLTQLLNQLQPGVTELMCHPAMIDPQLEQISSYVEPRMNELNALCDPTIKELLEKQGIELINYHHLQNN